MIVVHQGPADGDAMRQLASCAQLIFAPTFQKIIDSIFVLQWIVRTLWNDPRCRQMGPKFQIFSWGENLPILSESSRLRRSRGYLRHPNYCAHTHFGLMPILPSVIPCGPSTELAAFVRPVLVCRPIVLKASPVSLAMRPHAAPLCIDHSHISL